MISSWICGVTMITYQILICKWIVSEFSILFHGSVCLLLSKMANLKRNLVFHVYFRVCLNSPNIATSLVCIEFINTFRDNWDLNNVTSSYPETLYISLFGFPLNSFNKFKHVNSWILYSFVACINSIFFFLVC